MAVSIATLLLLIIFGFCVNLVKLALFKIRVRPEFESRAVDILAHRRFVKNDPSLSDRAKCIELLILEQKGEELLDCVIQDNPGKQVSRP